jgi:hypothetical protein
MELEPISTLDAYPLFLKSCSIAKEAQTSQLEHFVLRNFMKLYEVKQILHLYAGELKEGKTPTEEL